MQPLPPFPKKMICVEENDFGTFYIYPNIVVAVIQEGTNLDIDRVSELVAISERNFQLEDFVYISIRVNSYSIDPTIYSHLIDMKNLKGIGIVTEKTLYRQNFRVEKHFYSENMEIFDNTENAIRWAEALID